MEGGAFQTYSVTPQERQKFIQFPPTASTKLRDTRSQWNIHAVSKAYTVVWVLIQSLMSFTAPEDRFLQSLPGNGLSYQSWSDLALGFVRYHICISNLQQPLRRNTRDITRRISVLLFSLHLLHLLYLLHPQYPLHLSHLLHLLHLLHLMHLLLLFRYQFPLPIIENYSMAVFTETPSSPVPPAPSAPHVPPAPPWSPALPRHLASIYLTDPVYPEHYTNYSTWYELWFKTKEGKTNHKKNMSQTCC